jgi:hypothetical protein
LAVNPIARVDFLGRRRIWRKSLSPLFDSVFAPYAVARAGKKTVFSFTA